MCLLGCGAPDESAWAEPAGEAVDAITLPDDPRFPEQVNLYEWLGARREKQAVCLECPWTTLCEGFQVFRQDKPDMRVERTRPLVATA